ncbi:MAG: hypothetical protein WCC94_05330 [Candidatus Bathyarchaeia archaeon]
MKRVADGRVTGLTSPSFNARITVHEYGEGSFVVADDMVYFSNFSIERKNCRGIRQRSC